MWPTASLPPSAGTISAGGSSATPKRSRCNDATASRNSSEPWFVGYWCVRGSRAPAASASTTTWGVGRSGAPIPRLITSTPSRRFSAIFRSSSANRYGGTASSRRANLKAQRPLDERIDCSVQTEARAELALPGIGIASHASQRKLLRELDGADLLRRSRQPCLAVPQLDPQVAPREVDLNGALAPSVRDGRRAGGDGARARGERLPRPALPDADSDVVSAVDAHELDVRSLGEALVRLDERAEAQQLRALGVAADDRVRVADRDGRQLDAFALDGDRLGLADLDSPHLLLDLAAAAHRRRHLPRPYDDSHLVAAAAAREPACRDTRPVPGELRRGAVGVPDHDLGAVTVGGDDLEDAVGADAEVVVADPAHALLGQRRRQIGPLQEQVVVAEAVPFRELHRAGATLPTCSASDRISAATSSGARPASTATRPGMRLLHFR